MVGRQNFIGFLGSTNLQSKSFTQRKRMLNRHNSSSDEDDQNFDHYKQIQYNGSAFDSDNNDSLDPQSESIQDSRRPSKIKPKNSKQLSFQQKSKAIKKNRESAKISRLRKKQYQDVLEQRVKEYEAEIGIRKTNINYISERILNKFKVTNKDKYKYLVQKMALSQKLLTISDDLEKLRESQEESKKNQRSNMIKLEDQSELINQEEVAGMFRKDQRTKSTKIKKRKGEAAIEEEKQKTLQTIKQKEQLLEMSIKAYMYEFGVKGCLRSDIIEHSKSDWLETLDRMIPYRTAQINENVRDMQESLEKLSRHTKLLDFHLRELRDRVKDKYVVQFLLDRQFFINNSEDTIYRNSQLKSSLS